MDNKREAEALTRMAENAADDWLASLKRRGSKPIPSGVLSMMRDVFMGGWVNGYGEAWRDGE